MVSVVNFPSGIMPKTSMSEKLLQLRGFVWDCVVIFFIRIRSKHFNKQILTTGRGDISKMRSKKAKKS